MIQKRNISTFAIVAALSIFLVPSASHALGIMPDANFSRTHTPGETVGPTARPPISCGNNCTQAECEKKLVWAEARSDSGWKINESGSIDNVYVPTFIKRVGLGSVTRYMQATGGYCYYYKGGTSSGASGPNTWRYDPS